jgi:hypothetical protein
MVGGRRPAHQLRNNNRYSTKNSPPVTMIHSTLITTRLLCRDIVSNRPTHHANHASGRHHATMENCEDNLTQEISTHHHGVNITPNADPDSDNIDDEISGEWQAKQATESPMFSYESDSTCSNRSCGREGLTLNRMAPV